MNSTSRNSRSARINGKKLAELRNNLGWTQVALANISGYCERVISKAEAGEPISYSAIRTLAQSLSVDQQIVKPQDLMLLPLEMAQEFIKTMAAGSIETEERIDQLFHSEIEIRIRGKEPEGKLSKIYRGKNQAHQFMRNFASISDSLPRENRLSEFQFLANYDQVVAWGELNHRSKKSSSITSYLVVFELRFCDNRIACCEIRFDSAFQQQLEQMIRHGCL